MSDDSSPNMSVIIVTPDCYETIRETIRCLRAQTARDRLEIIIVAPSADKLDLDNSELKDFLQYHVVELGEIRSIACAYAAGIRKARAPVVVLAEDHSYPVPSWAEALIEAHRQPWAVVGPVLCNANPGSMISWADFLMAYAPWYERASAEVIDHLPGHNSSYKRAILMEYGTELETMMEAETILHWNLRSKGYLLYLEPAAKTYHMNFSLLSSYIQAQFFSGRIFGASRALSWSLLHRLIYIGGAPIIPLVCLWRILRSILHSNQQRNLLPKVLPALVTGLIARSIGEMMGYALGANDAGRKLCNFEYHRIRHIKDSDRITIDGS